MARPFVVSTAELFRHRGVRHPVTVAGPLAGLVLSTSRLTDDDVVGDLVLEAQGDAVTVTGTITGGWTGECRRCLEATGGAVTVEVTEVFEPHPVEGETYALGREEIDLEPLVREALALALPVAPLCDETCPGPDPRDHPVMVESGDEAGGAGDDGPDGAPSGDPRWAALDALRFDS